MIRIFIACLVLLTIAAPAYAEVVGSEDLINNASKYSNTTVEFHGEVIGDIMKRGSHGWINVNDGYAAIGVWAPVEMFDKISASGDYRHKGDTVIVKGTFNQVCGKHGGDLDIHAADIVVKQEGSKITHSINNTKLLAAEFLVLVTIALYFINRFRVKR